MGIAVGLDREMRDAGLGTAMREAKPLPKKKTRKDPKPKFRVGQIVSYRRDRRTRRKITERYWDPNYPSWRYRFCVPGLRRDLQAAWAVIESDLVAVEVKSNRRVEPCRSTASRSK